MFPGFRDAVEQGKWDGKLKDFAFALLEQCKGKGLTVRDVEFVAEFMTRCAKNTKI